MKVRWIVAILPIAGLGLMGLGLARSGAQTEDSRRSRGERVLKELEGADKLPRTSSSWTRTSPRWPTSR